MTAKRKKRSAVASWNAAVAEAYAGDSERDALASAEESKKALADVLAMSDADVDRELTRLGVDVAELDRRSLLGYEAFRAKVRLPEKPELKVPDAGPAPNPSASAAPVAPTPSAESPKGHAPGGPVGGRDAKGKGR